MAKKLQLRGGTTSEHSTFTGAAREVTVDTTKDSLVVHDGATAGGIPLAKSSDITLGTLSVTADATELNKLDGATASTAELNHVTGVTSSIQTQLGTLTTGLGNVNTDLVNDTTPQLGGDLDLNGHVITGLASSNVSSDLLVATGETVTAGQTLSLVGNTVGTNPQPPAIGATVKNGTIDFTFVNSQGTVGLVSGNGVLSSYLIGDTTTTLVSSNVSIFSRTAYVFSRQILQLSDTNNVLLAQGTHASNTCYGDVRVATINPTTGTFSLGSTTTRTLNGGYSSGVMSFSVSPLDTNETNTVSYYHRGRADSGGGYAYFYGYGSFKMTGTSISHSSMSTNVGFGAGIVTGSKILDGSSNTSWSVADWSGTLPSNTTTITTEYTDGAESPLVYRPTAGVNRFVFFFKTNSSQLVAETYTSNGSNLVRVANSRFVISNEVTTDYKKGDVRGTATNLVFTWSDNNKGYVLPLALDSNKIITTSGITSQISSSNSDPKIRYSGTSNIYRTWRNTSGAVNQKVTIPSYDSNDANIIGIAKAGASAGATVSVATRGVVGGLAGLTAGSLYYYDTAASNGSLTTTPNAFFVGPAVSTTEIKL